MAEFRSSAFTVKILRQTKHAVLVHSIKTQYNARRIVGDVMRFSIQMKFYVFVTTLNYIRCKQIKPASVYYEGIARHRPILHAISQGRLRLRVAVQPAADHATLGLLALTVWLINCGYTEAY